VVAVAHRDMPTTGAVNVGMILMGITGHTCNIRPAPRPTKQTLLRIVVDSAGQSTVSEAHPTARELAWPESRVSRYCWV
jgi:hypothetical protein